MEIDMHMQLNKPEFLIRINADYFLSEVDGRQISGTPVPSAASHFDYRSADRICAGLRVHGYPQAHVTDALGSAITREMLQTALESERAESNLPAKVNMSLDEISTYEEAVELWILTHAAQWKKFAGEANEKLLLDGAKKYRRCVTAVDRSFHDNKAKASFARTDGGNEESDRIEAQQRRTAREQRLDAEASAEVAADPAFIEHIMSLSLPALQQAYYGDAEFARRYRAAVRDHGFHIPPRPATAGGQR